MSTFREARATSRPDPFKRVKYTLGLVLGVDEFEQEQTYFLEAGRRHARSQHGYGTVCGLEVTNDGLEVKVGPGLAVTPRGRELRVTTAHCAKLDDWLDNDKNRIQLAAAIPPPSLPPGMHSVYVTLCYLECETDEAPIPGTPCRSDDESMAPSRISESFELKFAVAPPDQTEEEAVRALGRLLDRIQISSDPADEAIDGERMRDEVRALLDLFPTDGRTPVAPSDAPLFIRPDQLASVLDAGLRVWVTEVRPALLPEGKNCVGGPPDEDCILLARVDFAADDSWRIDPESVDVVQEDRPVLLHSRVLAELLRHMSEGVTDHGRLSGLEDDDHRQYLPVDPTTRALKCHLDAGGKKIINLLSGTQAGEAVTAERAVKVNDAAQGDLGGVYPNPIVVGLRGAPVLDDPAKKSGWALTWNGAGWIPRPVSTGGGGVDLIEVAARLPTLPFVTITRVPRLVWGDDPRSAEPTFELWFHLDVDATSRANLPKLFEEFHVRVYVETDRPTPAGSPYLTPVSVTSIMPKPGARNVFLITVEQRIDLYEQLRFVFRPAEMMVEMPEGDRFPLWDWMQKRPLKWEGHDGAETITAFYKNDVRQKVVASGTFDIKGSVYAAHNLEVPSQAPKEDINGQFIRWGGYDLRKRPRYVVKGVPFWMEQEIEFSRIPLFFQVLHWHKEGLFVVSREAGGGPSNALIGTSIEISEIL